MQVVEFIDGSVIVDDVLAPSAAHYIQQRSREDPGATVMLANGFERVCNRLSGGCASELYR